MSYEGQFWYITKRGKLVVTDCYDDGPEDAEYYASQDLTNGYEDGDISTHDPHYEIIGEEDVWHHDHYGNKYATKVKIYAPINGDGFNNWRKVT